MKVLPFSRQFPKGHPKTGQHTHFVEKIWACPEVSILNTDLLKEEILNFQRNEYLYQPKWHTIRTGNRWKDGDMASLRIWSDKPYRSKQIEFAQVEVKKVWQFNIHAVDGELIWQIPGVGSGAFDAVSASISIISRRDGLEAEDFINWFAVHPKKRGAEFSGQIISWSDKIEY